MVLGCIACSFCSKLSVSLWYAHGALKIVQCGILCFPAVYVASQKQQHVAVSPDPL